jgi:hypothetical protein
LTPRAQITQGRKVLSTLDSLSKLVEKVWNICSTGNFVLCIAIDNHVLCIFSVDRLRRRGLQHPVVCVLCDQEQETMQHLLCTCSFARQFWYAILVPLCLGDLIPAVDKNLIY